MAWYNILGSIASAGINYHTTKALNEQNAELQNKYWNSQTDKSFALNEKSADNAMKRSLSLYNLTQSPQAMTEQLKKAGLNPALMYSGSGMGGQITQGPQGGANGAGNINTFGLQQILDPLTSAQIKNIDADTKNKEESAKNKNQDTKVKKAQEDYTKSLTTLKNLESQFLNNKVTISNATIQEEINKIKASSELAFEELKELKLKNGIDKETFNTKVKTIEQNYFNMVAQGEIMELEQDKMKTIIDNTKMDTKEKEQKIKNLEMEFNWLRNKVMISYNEINKSASEKQTEIDKQNLMKAEAFKIYEELSQRYGGWNKEDFFRMWESIWGKGVIPTIIDYKNIKPIKH